MNKDYKEQLIIKYLSEETSDEENQILRRLIEEEESFKKHFVELRDLWNLSNAQQFNAEKAFSKFVDKTRSHNLGKRRAISWFKYVAAAASILIMFLVGKSYLSYEATSLQQYTYSTMGGERKLIRLPDSSKVWLHGYSKLFYSSDFNKSKRTVNVRGEAFFDVAHNDDKPFEVVTDEHKITVLGTRFYVSANHQNVETVLEEGSVEVSVKDGQQLCILQPGQKSVFDINNGQLSKMEEPNVSIYSAISIGRLVFKNETLAGLAPRLENWFGVTIQLNEAVESMRFTGTIENESLEDVLKIMSMSNGITYTKENDSVMINLK